VPETTQTIGKQICFAELFREFQQVQIPIVQRDYAQGREGQEELRKEFLSTLKEALDKEDNELTAPLDLDFVYGSAFGGPTGHANFAPLDGQQRLTTLFLLHWYLAWKDEQAPDFQERFVNDQRSRMSYEVRPSSYDFFNSLALNFPEESAGETASLRDLIEDKPWFFRSWKHDPTILSALTMLEAIHHLFGGCDGYYQRLIDHERPRITFQLLELKHFGLSDDLYIKMNARGKSLTPFETFKARLEQHLDELLPDETRDLHGSNVTVKEYFSRRMDIAWADLFWAHYKRPYDEEMMRLIKAVALVSLDLGDGAENTLTTLRGSKFTASFSQFCQLGCLNRKMLTTLEAVLDYWSGIDPDKWKEDAAVFDSRAAFDSATTHELSYPELVKFAAFCSFVRTHRLPPDRESLNRWLRVISNLVENSDIERPSDFIDALRSLDQLEPHMDRILDYLAAGSEVTAFNRQQVREERIKAALIMKSETWRERIFAAEGHDYFKGQIEFLLKFSGILDHWLEHKAIAWSAEEDTNAQRHFSDYLEKAAAVFDGNGLRRFDESKWERALLGLGDYTLAYSRNHSFLQNKVGGGGRRPTWKLLLRGHMLDSGHEKKRLLVKDLLDKLDLKKAVEASLDDMIKARSVKEPWREMLVEAPQMIAYCDQKMFRRLVNGAVYLISKLRTSSEHVELWTYYLYQKIRGSEALSPFTISYFPSYTDDDVPFAQLRWRDEPVVISIYSANEKYRLSIAANVAESHQFLINQMEQMFDFETKDSVRLLQVSKDNIEPAIREIARLASAYRQQSA
jgi:hypothetical protein